MLLCLVAKKDLAFDLRRIGVRAHSLECGSPIILPLNIMS